MPKKSFFILLALINAIICNFFYNKDCTSIKGYNANCASVNIGKEGYSCFPEYIYETNCIVFPNDKEKQKIFLGISNGIYMESQCITYTCPRTTNNVYSNEFDNQMGYETGETIKYKGNYATDEEVNIINNENNCIYLSNKYLKMQKEGQLDITQDELKQKCFNADKFPTLDNILECGYGKIKVKKEDGSYFSKNTCFLIPDLTKIKDQEDYILFYKKKIEESIIYSVFGYNLGLELSKNELDIYDYSFIMEDKNGNYFGMQGDTDEFKYTKDDEQTYEININMNYCLFDDNMSLSILEKKNNQYEFHPMKSDVHYSWSTKIKYNRKF